MEAVWEPCACVQKFCGPGFTDAFIDVAGNAKPTCLAAGPTWGQRAVTPSNVFTVKKVVDDSVVEDAQTKLMWKQATSPNALNWTSGRIYCDALVYAGFNDWRLPSVHELASLVDHAVGLSEPAIDRKAFPSVASAPYWTSNLEPGLVGELAFSVGFLYGRVLRQPIDARLEVLCVRGTAPAAVAPRFQVQNGVVRDRWTSLEWQQAPSSEPATWAGAKSYCQQLGIVGGGWRLPSVRELHGIVNPEVAVPAIDTGPFPKTPTHWFWTQTPRAGTSALAWAVDFFGGNVFQELVETSGRVRCVR